MMYKLERLLFYLESIASASRQYHRSQVGSPFYDKYAVWYYTKKANFYARIINMYLRLCKRNSLMKYQFTKQKNYGSIKRQKENETNS